MKTKTTQPTIPQLEQRLDRQLKKPRASPRAVRKTREDLIKLKWAMGL